MKFSKFKLTALASIAFAAGPLATAQSIDYGSLELLFDEPVTTSATGAPQRSTEAPVTMEIISAADIRDSGARRLADLLSRVVGVEVMEYGNSSPSIAIRGYNHASSPRLLVLLNGRQVFQDFYGFTDWDVIPVQLEEIRQIEIVKGPNTALFGFNAVGGVVNIITHNPIYDDASSVKIGVGADGESQGAFTSSFKLHEKVGLRLSLGGETVEEYDGVVADYRTDPENTRTNLAAELGFQLTASSQLFLEASDSTAKKFTRSPDGSETRLNAEFSGLRAQYVNDSNFGLLRFDVYQNTSDYDLISQFSGTAVDISAELLALKAEDTFKIGTDHTFRLSAEYRQNDLTFIFRGLPVETNNDILSAGLMWNWQVSETVATTISVRTDQLSSKGDTLLGLQRGLPGFDEETTEYSYNAALLWKPTEKDTFRFQAARGIQTPSLVQTILSTGIESSVIDNYAIDYDRPVEAINGNTRVSVFYQQNKDLFTLANALYPPGVPVLLGPNLGDSEVFGIELSADGRIADNFDWFVSYAYQETSDELLPVVSLAGAFSPLNFEESNLDHQFKFGGTYTRDKWRLGTQARLVPDHARPDASDSANIQYRLVPVDGYLALDLTAGYEIKEGVELSLDGFNLTNDGDAQTPLSAVDSRFMLSLRVDF